MTFVFKHPKYYKELRARNKSDQAISCAIGRRPSSGRAPGQGLKLQAREDSTANSTRGQVAEPQAASSKLQAPSLESIKPQASSPKQQASSSKPQASSSKILEPR